MPNLKLARTLCGLAGIVLTGAAWLPVHASQATPPVSRPAPGVDRSALITKYCVTCHSERLKTGNLVLEKVDAEQVATNPAFWEKVVRKLHSRSMPPVGMPRPDATTSAALIASLETALDRAAAAAPNPGRSVMHRLNQAEYGNAIRDLLALDLDTTSLIPADDSSYGFDNIADILTIDAGRMDRYLSAARKVSRLAVGDPTISPELHRYDVSPLLMQNVRMSEDLPFGSQGGIAVRHFFPLDGEYVLTVRLRGDALTPNSDIYSSRRIPTSADDVDVRLDGVPLPKSAIGKSADRGSDMQIRFRATGGPHLLGVAFQQMPTAPDAIGVEFDNLPVVISSRTLFLQKGLTGITVGGPFNGTTPQDSPSRRQIFACRPGTLAEEEPCARKIASTLARRAFRRPVAKDEVDRLLTVYRAGRKEGTFDAGVQKLLEKILVSLDFLFRIESDPAGVRPGTAFRVSDVALASRLSFFLWSSIPDGELLDVAESGKLKDPAVLERQVRRMLRDPRASALTANFGGQWLYLRNVPTVTPESKKFPEFDENLREAFRRETELFLDSQIREDFSVTGLLTAPYTFVNGPLAKHYGIPNVYGSHFQRVSLPEERRAGLLGHASILTVTSLPTRTSPVKRGKWLLENLLGAPPPPPPPNVEGLVEKSEDGKVLTMRQQMEQHRRNPVCASCHAQMDPLGFSLENYDALGRWRTVSQGSPIDASGTLPDGTKFVGVTGLRDVFLSRREEFVTTVTERLFTYALGRGVEYYDMPTVRAIVRQAAPGDYRWSAIVLGIIQSAPFQMRRAAS